MNNMISSLQCTETRPGKISPLSINRQESIGPVRRVDWDQSLVELTHTTRQGCRKTQLGLTGFVQKNNTHHRYTVCIVMYIDTCTSTLYSQESTFNDLEHIYIIYIYIFIFSNYILKWSITENSLKTTFFRHRRSPIPFSVIEAWSKAQQRADCGLFAELHHAWASLDQTL